MSAETRCDWKLPQIIEIATIGSFYEELAKLDAQQTQVVTLDVEDVVVVDTSALQVLAAFVRSLMGRGGRVEWENLSVPLYQSAIVLDLQDALAL